MAIGAATATTAATKLTCLLKYVLVRGAAWSCYGTGGARSTCWCEKKRGMKTPLPLLACPWGKAIESTGRIQIVGEYEMDKKQRDVLEEEMGEVTNVTWRSMIH